MHLQAAGAHSTAEFSERFAEESYLVPPGVRRSDTTTLIHGVAPVRWHWASATGVESLSKS